MTKVAERVTDTTAEVDFLRRSYEQNGEPLRLLSSSEHWYGEVLKHSVETSRSGTGLILGGTPWLARLAADRLSRLSLVDRSAAMLEMCRELRAVQAWRCSRIDFIQGDWLQLTNEVGRPDLIAGDNSLNFLHYPDQWHTLLEVLAARASHRAVLLLRMMVVPDEVRILSVDEIEAGVCSAFKSGNLTALRVSWLLAHRDAASGSIQTEEALASFDARKHAFPPLLNGQARDDLTTMEKYRGTGVKYSVPRLSQAMSVLGDHLRVVAIHFGSYAMGQYFPLIVAKVRP